MEHFAGEEIERIYLASTLDEAKRVEAVLDASPFLYSLDLEKFMRPVSGAFGGHVGVGFYVPPASAKTAKDFLAEKGFLEGIEGGD